MFDGSDRAVESSQEETHMKFREREKKRKHEGERERERKEAKSAYR